MVRSHYTHKGHLSQHERADIEHLMKAGKSMRFIARRLDSSPSTISREMQRNSGLRGYRHCQAHEKSWRRQRECSRYRELTDTMKAQAYPLLKEHWSPEQIVGRWKHEGKPSVSVVTLYAWIHQDHKTGGVLHRFLRHQGSRYGHGYGRKAYTQCIPQRVGIEYRPAIVEPRTRVGDWEADTMHGTRHQGFPVTLVECTARFTLIAQVNHKEKRAVQQTITSMLQSVKDWVHRSV